MKRPSLVLSLTIFLTTAVIPLFAQHIFKTTSQSVIGYLQYVPKDYATNSNKYPVVIFLHGYGERGPNSTDPSILQSAIWSVCKNGPAKYVKYGTHFPFILISPQLKSNYGGWPGWYIKEVIDHVKTQLRIDEKRIHVTGFSMGGGGTWTAIQEYPKLFASASPICGGNNSPSKACGIAAESLPVWAFHGDQDAVVPLSRSVNMVNAINNCSPAPSPRAKLTIYPGIKHTAWFRAYDLTHAYHNPNLYDWIMAQYNTKTGSNRIPSANAGSDVSVAYGSSVSLRGSATDADGSVGSYSWKKISGPNVSVTQSGAGLTLNKPASGTYFFHLQVTDNGGATDSDYVRVTVGSGGTSTTTNSAPVAQAGADASIVLPVNSVVLTGSGTDSDGSISSYGWSKVSGGACSLSGTTTAKLGVAGMVAGTYVFRLTVKDNGGASDTDDVTVVVKSSTTTTTTTRTTNAVPSANAGADRLVSLPSTSLTLSGTGSDTDGTISSYNWVQISGPSVSLSGTTTARPVISNPVSGVCVFRLTVKDNAGATSYDDVKVTFSYPPVANAGENIHRTSRVGFSIAGKGTDRDGTIASYTWTKTSGPSVTLSGQNSATLGLSNLVSGKYYFRLTVKDNTGLTHSDNTLVVIP